MLRTTEKKSGAVSEALSAANPLNWYGGSQIGGLAALALPTRSLKQQAAFDAKDNTLRAVANVLVPGYGAYNSFKRIGAGIRSPEMKAIKKQREQDRARRELEALEAMRRAHDEDDTENKSAGWKTEAAGTFLNPLNLLGGNYLGAGLAAVTPTRTLNEQAEADEDTWSNIFVPGKAQHNWWKRIGAVSRSPEMQALQRQARIAELERAAGKSDKKEDAEKKSRAYEAGESLADMPIKKTKMSHKKCTPAEFGAMVKEAAAEIPWRLLGSSVGGALAGSYGPYLATGKANPALAAAGSLGGTTLGAAWEYLAHKEKLKKQREELAQKKKMTAQDKRNLKYLINTKEAADLTKMPAPLLGSQTLGILRQAPSIFKSWVPASSAAGALVGAGIGATNDDGLLGGALRGGLIGAGAGFGGPLSAGAGVGLAEDLGSKNIAVPVGAGAAGAVGGGYAGNALYNALAGKKKKTKKRDKTKTKSARDFGAYVKQSFNILEYLPQSAAGQAALGAGLGGLAGYMMPGDDEEDNGSALRRALLGAGLGGLAGYGMNYLGSGGGAGSSPQQAAPQSLATQSGQQSTVSPTGAAAATSQNRYGSLVPPAATASSPAAGTSLDPATQNKIVQGLRGVGSGLDAAAAFTNPGLLFGHTAANGLNALQQYGASLGKKIKARPAPTKPFYSPDPAMREVMRRPVAGFKPNKQRRPFD